MSYEEELAQERAYTARVQQLLYAAVRQSDAYIASHDQSIRMILADAWDELRLKPTALSPQDLEQLSIELDRFTARKAFNEDMARRCGRMLHNPFFGRVDFREDGATEAERIVIGLYSLRDEKGDLLVHDWRAPVCSLYYDGQPGPAAYTAPAGSISGELLLKRQYRMAGGALEYFVDTSDSIDDAMLLDILSQATSRHMRQIVSSIQREQNEVIRTERAPVLCVVGAAGSGKTSVALHRASYLLYAGRERLDASRVAILSPSTAFVDHISEVLPDLGEENIVSRTVYATLKGLLGCRVELPQDQNEAVLTRLSPLRARSIAEKEGEAFCRRLAAFADRFREEGPRFTDITAEGTVLVRGEDLTDMYRREFAALSPALRLTRIRSVLERLTREYTQQLRFRLKSSLASKFHGRELETAVRLAVSEQTRPLRGQIGSQLRADPLLLYAEALAYDEELALAARQNAEKRLVWWEDAPAVAWLMCELGFAPRDDSLRHLIIDEAQDYPLVLLRALRLLYPKAQVTILGDPAQRTCPALPPCDPALWGACFGADDAPIRTMRRCYRSSLPIAGLLGRLLPEGEQLVPFGRPGRQPQISAFSPDALRETLDGWRSEGLRSVCVVTRSMAEAERLASRLPGCALLADEEDMLPEEGTVVAAGLHLLKGLEFDAVAVVWPDVPLDDGERRRLYTACSRALHALAVFAGEEVRSLLEGAAPEAEQ